MSRDDGATLREIGEVFAAYVEAVTAHDGPVLPGYRVEVRDALAAFRDALQNQIEYPEPADTRDSMTLAEWRKEIGLCPDTADHFAARCHRYQCRTFVDDLAAEHPFVPVAELGRYV